jgi:hypothetical protein
MSAPRSGTRITATVATTITGIPRELHPAIVALDPTRTLTGFGPLPAVITTTHHGSWQEAGDARTVTFSDGSTACEVITDHHAPDVYAYRLTKLSGVLGHLAQHADSAWHFTADGASTRCEWSFTFIAKPGRGTVIRLALLPVWTAYMRKVLRSTTTAVHSSPNV